jgi:hypothetical protein
MFTRDNMWMLLPAAFLLMMSVVYGYVVGDNTDKCDQQGGVLVNTPTGWKCVEAKVLL